MQVPVLTVLVAGSEGMAVPVAWITMSHMTRKGIQECLELLVAECAEIKPGFSPSCAVADTAYSTQLAIRSTALRSFACSCAAVSSVRASG